MTQVLTFLLVVAVQLYRIALSPFLGGRCRYLPSCSEYAIESLRAHGPWRGGLHALRRVLGCHPLGGFGYDPVPHPVPPPPGGESFLGFGRAGRRPRFRLRKEPHHHG